MEEPELLAEDLRTWFRSVSYSSAIVASTKASLVGDTATYAILIKL